MALGFVMHNYITCSADIQMSLGQCLHPQVGNTITKCYVTCHFSREGGKILWLVLQPGNATSWRRQTTVPRHLWGSCSFSGHSVIQRNWPGLWSYQQQELGAHWKPGSCYKESNLVQAKMARWLDWSQIHMASNLEVLVDIGRITDIPWTEFLHLHKVSRGEKGHLLALLEGWDPGMHVQVPSTMILGQASFFPVQSQLQSKEGVAGCGYPLSLSIIFRSHKLLV